MDDEENTQLLPTNLKDAQAEIVRLRLENQTIEERRRLLMEEATARADHALRDKISIGIGRLRLIRELLQDDGSLYSMGFPTGLVGLYFGGKWCKYCQQFSLQLQEFLEENRARGFHVIFVSTDHSQADYDNFSVGKGFLRIPWDDHALRADLLRDFGVCFFPSLVVVRMADNTSSSTSLPLDEDILVTKLGASAVQAERFPGHAIGAWRKGESGYLPAWLERKRTMSFNPLGMLVWMITIILIMHFIVGYSFDSIFRLPFRIIGL